MVLNAHRRSDLKRAARMAVKLDGVLVPCCFYADGRRGVVREYVKDEKGDFVIDLVAGEIVRRERRGKVTWVRV